VAPGISSLTSTVLAFSLCQAHHVGRGVLLGGFLSRRQGFADGDQLPHDVVWNAQVFAIPGNPPFCNKGSGFLKHLCMRWCTKNLESADPLHCLMLFVSNGVDIHAQFSFAHQVFPN